MVAFDLHRIGAPPEFAAVVERKTPQRVFPTLLVVVEQINSAVADRGARVPIADLDLPEDRRAGGRPGVRQR
ncbi:MAG TPA: hypothetical protein P5175_08485, partial [Anaerohalosphaeraceae bacterium]|nr:hypothetical protein [Anaerohalosphaeraceae bacterium]